MNHAGFSNEAKIDSITDKPNIMKGKNDQPVYSHNKPTAPNTLKERTNVCAAPSQLRCKRRCVLAGVRVVWLDGFSTSSKALMRETNSAVAAWVWGGVGRFVNAVAVGIACAQAAIAACKSSLKFN